MEFNRRTGRHVAGWDRLERQMKGIQAVRLETDVTLPETRRYLMDLRRPDLNGLDVMIAIRSELPMLVSSSSRHSNAIWMYSEH
jgi:CheY-like chemotaxis protein